MPDRLNLLLYLQLLITVSANHAEMVENAIMVLTSTIAIVLMAIGERFAKESLGGLRRLILELVCSHRLVSLLYVPQLF